MRNISNWLVFILVFGFCACNQQPQERQEIGTDGVVAYTMGTSDYYQKYQQALSFIESGKLAEAEQVYLELMEIDSSNLMLIHVGLGTVKNRQMDYTQAIYHFTQALAIDPSNYQVYLGFGAAYYDQRFYNEALQYYRTAIGLAPDRPDAYWGISNVFAAMGESDSSALYARKFMEMEPDSKYHDMLKAHQAHQNE